MANKHDLIRLRRGTAAEWAATEPQPGGEVLKLGEPGFEKDTYKLKIGDGITPWNNLPYIAGGVGGGDGPLKYIFGDNLLTDEPITQIILGGISNGVDFSDFFQQLVDSGEKTSIRISNINNTNEFIVLRAEAPTKISGSPDQFVFNVGEVVSNNLTLTLGYQYYVNIDIVSSSENSFLKLTNNGNDIQYFIGEPVSFIKTDYGDEVDEIDTGLSITRDQNQGIYNPVLEPGWDNNTGDPDGRSSPKNTLWNSQGWGDLTNLNARSYNTFFTAVNGNLGNNVLSPNFIMKDVVNDKYYKIDFTVWGNANIGAPVTYTRQQVDGVTGDDIGSPVTFTKLGYEDPFLVYDDIDTGLKISRSSNQGIFNIELETSWNSNSPGDGDRRNSPEGTEWNLEGWADLSNIKTRTYKAFYDIFDGNLGNKILNSECVMHDIANDNYYAIKFTGWTGGGNGGGFSYIRRLINKNIVFVHSAYGSEVDDIEPNIGITRGENGAIYNPYDEGSWDDDVSPGGTLWNFDGFEDLSNVESRIYTTFFQAISYYGIGNKIEGSEAIMKVISSGDYYKIKFLSWQRGGGGAFSYIRSSIDTTKLNEGIRFADGTVQKTASNPIKFRAPIQRKIEEYCGFKVLDISEAMSYNLDSTVKFSVSNNNYISIVFSDEQTAEQFAFSSNEESETSIRNMSISLDDGESWIGVKSTGWGNSGGWYVSYNQINDGEVFTASPGDPVKIRYWRGGVPQKWFDPNNSPGGYGYFRGAVIEYHAYSMNSGTLIGQIIISNDISDYNVTHSESVSGGNDLSAIDLWLSKQLDDSDDRSGRLYAWRTDGEADTIKIQWKATMFYGLEFWD
jgi:hypothetical protein